MNMSLPFCQVPVTDVDALHKLDVVIMFLFSLVVQDQVPDTHMIDFLQALELKRKKRKESRFLQQQVGLLNKLESILLGIVIYALIHLPYIVCWFGPNFSFFTSSPSAVPNSAKADTLSPMERAVSI